MHIEGGLLSDNTAAGDGGGAFSDADLTFQDCTVSGNKAGGKGGGVSVSADHTAPAYTLILGSKITGNSAGTDGGGFFASCAAVGFQDCTIADNAAGANGGGILCDNSDEAISASTSSDAANAVVTAILGLKQCTVSGNTAVGNAGGVGESGGSFTLIQSVVEDNRSGAVGGGILVSGVVVEKVPGVAFTKQPYYAHADLIGCIITGNSAGTQGGGFYSDYTWCENVVGCVISGNSAGSHGGGVSMSHLRLATMELDRCTVTDNTAGWGNGGGINIQGAVAVLDGCTIGSNTGGSQGGGIYVAFAPTLRVIRFPGAVQLNTCVVSGNTSQIGGGVAGYGAVLVLTIGCTVSDNTATLGGGGVSSSTASGMGYGLSAIDCTIRGNAAPEAGGVFVSGDAVMAGCTISGNHAVGSDNPYAGAGGGVGGFAANLTLFNCTIADNTAALTGGGVSLRSVPGDLTMIGCTVSGNTAGAGAGGVYVKDFYANIYGKIYTNTASFINAIVAGNSGDQVNGPYTAASSLIGGARWPPWGTTAARRRPCRRCPAAPPSTPAAPAPRRPTSAASAASAPPTSGPSRARATM